MRGLKYVHFLEGTKDGNKYMDGWVSKLKMGPEKDKQINFHADQPWETSQKDFLLISQCQETVTY